jgi:hypothetical protein
MCWHPISDVSSSSFAPRLRFDPPESRFDTLCNATLNALSKLTILRATLMLDAGLTLLKTLQKLAQEKEETNDDDHRSSSLADETTHGHCLAESEDTGPVMSRRS